MTWPFGDLNLTNLSLQVDVKQLLVALTQWCGYRRYVVPTRWLCVSYRACNGGHSARTIWGRDYWSLRLYDLTFLDFFFWNYLKLPAYTNKSQIIDALKVNRTNAIWQIQPVLWNKVMENRIFRIRACKKSRGGHLNDVIFHAKKYVFK